MTARLSLLLVPALVLAGCATRDPAPTTPPEAIGAVQGTGNVSLRLGDVVTLDAVSTLRIQGDRGGLYVQDTGDGNPATSDALLLVGPATRHMAVGQQVVVTGTVRELDTGRGSSLTALEVGTLHGLGTKPLPPAIPLAPAQFDEAHEGMRVAFDTLTLVGHEGLARDGTLLTATSAPPWTPTERARPGTPEARMLADTVTRTRVRLDDAALDGGLRADAPWPAALATARTGSTLHGVDGVLDPRDGGWRVQVRGVERIDAAPRPQAPHVAGDLRIGAMNLENLFNGDGAGGGFPTPRGARTPVELAAQLARHVATLRALDADAVALMELENDGHGPRSAEGELVAALGGPWRSVEVPGLLGSDQIRVGLIYRSDRVRPVGRVATLGGGPFDGMSRVPLVRAFQRLDARGRPRGAPVAVVALHLKSKGCGGAQGLDADQRDGQSCFNATRADSVRRLHAWLATDPTGVARGRTLLLGDFNAYAQEDPVATLRDAGWQDAFALAGVEAPYSYVYNGQRGRLDHALASPALAPAVVGAAEWHVNADEPETLGYREAPQATGPWRGSDHDPLVVGLRIGATVRERAR